MKLVDYICSHKCLYCFNDNARSALNLKFRSKKTWNRVFAEYHLRLYSKHFGPSWPNINKFVILAQKELLILHDFSRLTPNSHVHFMHIFVGLSFPATLYKFELLRLQTIVTINKLEILHSISSGSKFYVI